MTREEWIELFREDVEELERKSEEIDRMIEEINMPYGENLDIEEIRKIYEAIEEHNQRAEELKRKAVVLKYLIDNKVEILDEVDKIFTN